MFDFAIITIESEKKEDILIVNHIQFIDKKDVIFQLLYFFTCFEC